ncbi:ubl carboxyl-terminal hydrolase 18 [Pleuronectes platessa]|uniref:ubl carboxyl-terminal hydrolase 18 n=1 Tax=Pleuronectes platessa TaxID=8262 RepID=UPI00232A5DE0|nr:ubl carboxyl-terminal hydrolase 18 [Pleuronectes platessa]
MLSRFYSYLTLRDLKYEMRGLSNYQLSCCVNTLLQTLSATWELSELLERWDSAGVKADSHNVPLELKKVLSAMKSDHRHSTPHQDFLYCLDRNSFRLCVQHDADEVFLSILNFMQQQMDDRALALDIQNLYKVSVETRLQCLECSCIQTQTSFQLSLHLHVKEDQDSLEGCISSFLEDQELSGRDSCFCAQCERKTPSKRDVKLLSLPRILCMQLKRYRSSRGGIRKLDCRVTFPETFDFSELARGGFSRDFAQDEYTYTLYAVVVHSGGTMGGHYTAYVRPGGNQQWYYADDSSVEKVSWERVQGTYGKYYGGTAYMLMYRRSSKEEGRQPEFSG